MTDVDGHDVEENQHTLKHKKKKIDIFYTACTPKKGERMKKAFLDFIRFHYTYLTHSSCSLIM